MQVSWDEPDLFQNVKRVSPWQVEVMSTMPLVHLSPFSPQRKKLRLPQPPDLPQGDFTLSPFTGNHPLGPIRTNVPASIQGARHAQFGIPFLDLKLNPHKHQLGLFLSTLNDLDEPPFDANNDDVSCLLTMGSSSVKLEKSVDKVKAPLFLLFGQPIHIDQPISSDTDSQVSVVNYLSNENGNDFMEFQTAERKPNIGHLQLCLF